METGAFLGGGGTLPYTFWDYGNRTAMTLFLTNDEEAIYCQRCWFFGDPSAMQNEWVNGVSSNPENFGVKIKSHEKPQAHLDASIAFVRWKAGQRNNRVQEQTFATEATFSRKHTCQLPSFGRSLSSHQNLRRRGLKYLSFEHQLFVLSRVASINIFR